MRRSLVCLSALSLVLVTSWVLAPLSTKAVHTVERSKLFPASAANNGIKDLFDGGTTLASYLPLPGANLETYYTLRRDLRRCASPMCGGYFVSGVNQTKTRCADGKYSKQCYVAEIDWNNQPGDQERNALVRGVLTSKAHPSFGKLGMLRVSESWTAATDKTPTGTFYRVRDLGVRCITHPCPTHEEARLNSTTKRKIAGVELTGVGASEDDLKLAFESMTGPEGIIASGSDMPVKGPGGRSYTFKANQFFLRTKSSTSANEKPDKTKACIKTGCSGIICADQEMMSTCEWKEEYACYRTARCERQSDGRCGFTQTRELTECIASKRKPS